MKKWLTTFAWFEPDGSLHIDIPKMLKHMGVADTVENRERASREALEYLLKECPDAQIVLDKPIILPPENQQQKETGNGNN
jgi:hypothetical protein